MSKCDAGSEIFPYSGGGVLLLPSGNREVYGSVSMRFFR